MLSPELQVWVKEHDPRTALADVFVAARCKNQSWAYKPWKATKDSQKPVSAQYSSRPSTTGGHDLPVLLDLIHPRETCNVALTRAQVKQSGETVHTWSAPPFYEAEVEAEPGKPHKSRGRRRQGKFQHTVVPSPVASTP
ncbi:hypothetical protein SKAU_G00076120 [Synaphobranchus kaupii]|uniref:Uncharacterized protein n=1 Tax=Synaphobranchus kaupii TaxID=118154 RepID=A0A9Q1G7Q4_SYNKA|nr:hypothetical protein SKAU_G00076120 [Synaphobranchus kaupii]